MVPAPIGRCSLCWLVAPITAAAPAPAAPPLPADCEWPACTRRCLPCERHNVGTCRLSFMHNMFNCKASRGPTRCLLGSCICEEGYCADEDGGRCVERVCVEGSLAPEYRPTWWVRQFTALAAAVAGEGPSPPDVLWDRGGGLGPFAAPWYMAPLVLLVPGLLVAGCTCLCHRTGDKLATSRAGSYEALMDPEMAVESLRPPCWPMFTAASGILVVIGVSVFAYQSRIERTSNMIDKQLRHAYADISTVANESVVARSTCHRLGHDLRDVPASCRVPHSTKESLTAMTFDEVDSCLRSVDEYAAIATALPGHLERASGLVRSAYAYVLWMPLVPLILVFAACLVIALEGLATDGFEGGAMVDRGDRGLALASAMFVLAIVAFAVAAAAELAAGVAAARFCARVDANILSYVSFFAGGAGTTLYDITRYYTVGDTGNPLLRRGELARKCIGLVSHAGVTLEGTVSLESLCPALGRLDVAGAMGDTRTILIRGSQLLNTTNIYPYYRKVVHEGVCGAMFTAFGSMFVLHVAVGLACFPLCACLAQSFLGRFVSWRQLLAQGDADAEGSSESDEWPDHHG